MSECTKWYVQVLNVCLLSSFGLVYFLWKCFSNLTNILSAKLIYRIKETDSFHCATYSFFFSHSKKTIKKYFTNAYLWIYKHQQHFFLHVLQNTCQKHLAKELWTRYSCHPDIRLCRTQRRLRGLVTALLDHRLGQDKVFQSRAPQKYCVLPAI